MKMGGNISLLLISERSFIFLWSYIISWTVSIFILGRSIVLLLPEVDILWILKTSIWFSTIDGHPLRYPGATEICNGYDDDCDGEVDEACELPWWYRYS